MCPGKQLRAGPEVLIPRTHVLEKLEVVVYVYNLSAGEVEMLGLWSSLARQSSLKSKLLSQKSRWTSPEY